MGKRERPKSYAMNDRKWFILYHLLTEVYVPLPPVTYEEYLKHVNQGERLPGSNLIKGDPTKDGLKKSIPEYIRHNDIAGIRSCVDDGMISLNGENVSDDTVRKMLLDWADKGFIKMGTKTNVRNLKYFFPDESRRGMDAFLDFLQGFGFDLEGRKALRNVSLVQTKYADVALTCDYVLYRMKKANQKIEIARKGNKKPLSLPFRGEYIKAFQDPRGFVEVFNRISAELNRYRKESGKEADEYIKGLMTGYDLFFSLASNSIELNKLLNQRMKKMENRPESLDEEDLSTYLTPEEWLEYDPYSILRMEHSHVLYQPENEQNEVRSMIKEACGEEVDEAEVDELSKQYWRKVSTTVSGILCMISHSFHALCYFNSFLNDETKEMQLPVQPSFMIKSGNYEGLTSPDHFIYTSNATDPTMGPLYNDLEEELVRLAIYDLIYDIRSDTRSNSAFNCFGNVYVGEKIIPSTLSYRVGDFGLYTIESPIREVFELNELEDKSVWDYHRTVEIKWKGNFVPFTPLIEIFKCFEKKFGVAKNFIGQIVYSLENNGNGAVVHEDYFQLFPSIHPEPPPSDHTYNPAVGYSKYKPTKCVACTVEVLRRVDELIKKTEQ